MLEEAGPTARDFTNSITRISHRAYHHVSLCDSKEKLRDDATRQTHLDFRGIWVVLAVQSLKFFVEPFLVLREAGTEVGDIEVDANKALGNTLLC